LFFCPEAASLLLHNFCQERQQTLLGLQDAGAVASYFAAKIYGLDILVEDIQV